MAGDFEHNEATLSSFSHSIVAPLMDGGDSRGSSFSVVVQPWHCIAEHRPLGNQSRARRRMYLELSTLRHTMNAVPHYEPTGDEVFE
jgi:hypothetical protein